MRRRAERLAQTRLRIVEATVELHRTVGPAATQISEVARRAGVQRATVYNHFPDDASLVTACSQHWRASHPAPDPSTWRDVGDPGTRLHTGLREVYAWFRETEPMTANILRDRDVVPALRPIVERGLGAYLTEVQQVLLTGWKVRGRRLERVRVAVGAALDFHVWHSLSALGDEQAAQLAAAMVERAAQAP